VSSPHHDPGETTGELTASLRRAQQRLDDERRATEQKAAAETAVAEILDRRRNPWPGLRYRIVLSVSGMATIGMWAALCVTFAHHDGGRLGAGNALFLAVAALAALATIIIIGVGAVIYHNNVLFCELDRIIKYRLTYGRDQAPAGGAGVPTGFDRDEAQRQREWIEYAGVLDSSRGSVVALDRSLLRRNNGRS
jgi:hypothetical protein